MEELIDSKYLVRVVDRFVSSLSPTLWEEVFTGRGAPSYYPVMMLKLILYAYSSQIYSSRQIAKAVRQDITFMWLAGMQLPNFNTINRFRSDYFRRILESVFTELLDFLHEKGYISFTDFFVDDTKLEANAKRYSTRDSASRSAFKRSTDGDKGQEGAPRHGSRDTIRRPKI